ncbi:hypothetical protein IH781_04100, partial [Patescibacteria group bacterium]|nr:hypothetical protein [Patescibacteria group bacterium]
MTWTAPGDDGSTGTATTYDVRYSTSNITAGNFSSATAATGEPIPSVAGSSETMTVSSLSVNTQYYFAMKTADEVPNTSGLSNVVSKYTLANAPTAAAFGSVTETSIAAKWTINGNPAGTEFYVENQTAVTNSGWIADNTAWTSSSLNASTEYSFRVKARNGGSIETAWVSLGSKSTSASSSDGDDSSTTTTTTAATPTPTPAVPPATGPTVAAPVVAPEPEAAAIGAPGTTTPDTSAGETTTEVPILPTESDTTPPTVTLTEAPEVVDKTKITFTGEAIAEEAEFSGVIAGLAYSLDNGTSWHPVSSVEGLGTVKASFTVTTPVLPDGTYDIIVRARDNTQNEGFSKITQTTIDLLPVIFGSAVLLQPSGDAFTTASPTTIAGSSIRLIAAFEGGVTEAKVKLANQNISLEPDNIKRRWGGIITLPEEGRYTIKLQARDGADNTFEQDIGTITVVPPLQTIDSKNNQPVAGANVTLEKFDENALIWRISRIPGQDNPQQASAEGSVSYLTDRGTFRLRVKAPGYWNGVSRSFTTNDPTPLSGTVQLPRRPWYMYLIPLRTRPLPLITQDLLAISPSTITDKNEQLNLLPRDLANAERTLDEFVGHRILITTVAAWNRSSQEQLAVLQRLQTKLGADVVIIPWLVQQPPSVLAGIITRGGYDLTGAAGLGGDFVLEYSSGTIETQAIDAERFGFEQILVREVIVRDGSDATLNEHPKGDNEVITFKFRNGFTTTKINSNKRPGVRDIL